ncbi:MAG: lysophospholipase [Thermoleophilia bacterium]|nr:lysophospholipase [Thermoleophilia bacterium]MDH4340168.1 lysophospholipase [Thermoleophilia bacterium]
MMQKRSFVRWLLGIATTLALGFLLACRAAAHLALGRPEWRVLEGAPEEYGLAADLVGFRSRDDLNVAAWWLTNDASGEPGRATVILIHGLGGNRSSMLPIAAFLVDSGYDVLAIDLRAHGESQGNYPSPGYLEVAEITAAVEYAHRRGSRSIVLLGHSVGGVAALHAAASGVDIVAVIADSAFVSFFDMIDGVRARQVSPWMRVGLGLVTSRSLAGLTAFMTRVGGGQRIDARRADLMPVLPHIRWPVLFVTGDRDDIALTANTRRMAAVMAVPGTRVAELHAGHQTYADAPREYERAVLGFLDEVIATSSSARGPAA